MKQGLNDKEKQNSPIFSRHTLWNNTLCMHVLHIGLFCFSLSLNPCFPVFYITIAFKSYVPPTFSYLDKTETFLLVADNEAGHILVFTTQGKYVSSFSSKGSGRDQLQFILCIAVDSDGYIYVEITRLLYIEMKCM